MFTVSYVEDITKAINYLGDITPQIKFVCVSYQMNVQSFIYSLYDQTGRWIEHCEIFPDLESGDSARKKIINRLQELGEI